MKIYQPYYETCRTLLWCLTRSHQGSDRALFTKYQIINYFCLRGGFIRFKYSHPESVFFALKLNWITEAVWNQSFWSHVVVIPHVKVQLLPAIY